MSVLRSRSARHFLHALAAAGASFFIAACSTSSDSENGFSLTNPGLNATAETSSAPPATADATGSVGNDAQTAAAADSSGAQLPEQVAYLPSARPSDAEPEAEAAASAEAEGSVPEDAPTETAAAAATVPEQPVQAKPRPVRQVVTSSRDRPQTIVTSAYSAPAAPARKRGFMASLFSANQAEAAPATASIEPADSQRSIEEEQAEKPLVTLASVEPTDQEAISQSSIGSYGSDALPGVRKSALFEIRRKSGMNDDSDVDLHEDESAPVMVASAAGMARLAPNGLLRQTESVDVACLKPALVSALRQIEGHFGRKLVVTSGYRSPTFNHKVRSARRSQHMFCAAADIQIPGVSKWDLAAYARTLPGRGGVGTYCHTESVHVDIGPERDWNWRCRRRRA